MINQSNLKTLRKNIGELIDYVISQIKEDNLEAYVKRKVA